MTRQAWGKLQGSRNCIGIVAMSQWEYRRRYSEKLKSEVLSHYGVSGIAQCCWVGCEVVDIDMLSLDHINDDGHKDLQRNGKRIGGISFYRHIKNQGFPTGLQTLFMNHQAKKELLRKRNLINEQITALREGSTTKTFDGRRGGC